MFRTKEIFDSRCCYVVVARKPDLKAGFDENSIDALQTDTKSVLR